MRYHITPAQASQLPGNLMSNLIRNAGLGIEYTRDPGSIHKFFTIGKIIDLINSHVNSEYHINGLIRDHDGWLIDAKRYSKRKEELIDALWDVFCWCYDYEKRAEEMKTQEDIWNKKPDEDLVDKKY